MRRLQNLINLYVKLAAAPEFVALKDKPNLWFGDYMANKNNDRYFAILDRENLKNIKKLQDNGLIYEDNLNEYYVDHDMTKRTMSQICHAYNKYFPSVNAFTVFQHLKDDGTLDVESGAATDTPIFILVHDLIHQVLQSNFVESLNKQRDREDESLSPTLLDELYEDIASSLSNFQPSTTNIGQGIFLYLRSLFNKKFNELSLKDPLDLEDIKSNLRQAIEATFHQAKAELRGKIDRLSNKSELGAERVPGPIKQLVDGILSRMKGEMVSQVPSVAEAILKQVPTDYRSGGTFGRFELSLISEEYYEKILDSKVVNQSDSSALRAWMQESLNAMQKLHNYFKFELEQELQEDYPPSSSSEDEDYS
jgi:hypothetical protein